MNKFKIGDKAIYLTDDQEVEVEILDIIEYPHELWLGNRLMHYRIIKECIVDYIGRDNIFKKNSKPYFAAKFNKLEKEVQELKKPKGFFARIFNK